MKRADFLKKVGNLKLPTKLMNPRGGHFGSGKKDLHAYLKAKQQKKKAPELYERKSHKDPKFAKLTIEEYEKLYPGL